MPLLYELGTGLYHAAIRSFAPFNAKANAWVQGRRGTWGRLEALGKRLHGCLWMHCASVGEFEQGRPVLEALAAERPDLPVLITFFSPSGYEACKDYAPPRTTGSATVHVDYLPPDGPSNARRLLSLVRPGMVLWVKYEFWFHHLTALKANDVPLFLVSGIFRKEQPFFRWHGGPWRRMLGCFTHLFVQDEGSRLLLAGIGVDRVTVSGDTRYDRVAAIAEASEELPIARAFRGAGPVLVCGSTWPQDEELLTDAFSGMAQVPKCIVVPHELHPAQLAGIEDRFPKPLVRWSELEDGDPENIAAMLGTEKQGTLLVDRMGLLARLYRYGDVAYVGGGFDTGIHNILEAAAWGVPMIFGPKHGKFREASGLMDARGGFRVDDAHELRTVLDRLLDRPETRQRSGEAAGRYVRERVGATRRVVQALEAKDDR